MEDREFRVLLTELLRSGAEGHVGRIHIISLEEVAAALGPEWKRLSAKAMAIAEAIIGGRMGRGDAYARTGDESFLLLLTGLGGVEAAIKVGTIAGEIRNRLLGDTAGKIEGLRVAHSMVPLAELRGLLGPDETPAPTPKPAPAEAGVARPAGGPLERLAHSLEFEYLPVWTAADEKITSWLMRPRRTIGESVVAGDDVFVAGPADPLAAELDLRIADLLDNRQVTPGQAPMIVPFYITPAVGPVRRQILAHIRDFDACRTDRHSVAFELVGLGEDIPRPLLRELVGAIAPCAAMVLARLPPDSPLVGPLADLGVRGLGLGRAPASANATCGACCGPSRCRPRPPASWPICGTSIGPSTWRWPCRPASPWSRAWPSAASVRCPAR